MAQSKDLLEFLQEAELQHHYDGMRNKLHVTNIAQLKYVEDEDLVEIGLTKPEIRRLKKQYEKEYPKGAFGKIRRILSARGANEMRNSDSRPVSQVFPSSKQVITEAAISDLKKLGEGQFGTVQQGVWTTEEGKTIQVAIKCLNASDMSNGLDEFLREASVMQSLSHDNILRLYGVILDSPMSPLLVTELAPLRSLLECLKDVQLKQILTVPRLCDYASQICNGMTYLESQRFVHRDLAARNVLVISKTQVKISDFGLSRALGVGKDYYQSNSPTGVKLPIAWCAPECMNYLRFTSASDVWAFGVTLWEMFNYGIQPWSGYTAPQILEALAEPNNRRLDRPQACPDEMHKLMSMCWQYEPEKRPSFTAIGPILTNLKLEQVQVVHENQLQGEGYLPLKVGDIVTILDKKPKTEPHSDLWRGVVGAGVTGFFSPKVTAPYIEVSTLGRSTKLTRHESAREGLAGKRRITSGMISLPQNDLRHIGHIGYDGAMYGDVAFIGSNYDKLPVKVQSPFKRGDTHRGSTISLPLTGQSDLGPPGNRLSSSTLVDFTNGNGLHKAYSQDNCLDLDDFTMPNLMDSFDFGSSLLDDIMEALGSNSQLTDSMKTSLMSSEVKLRDKQNHNGVNSKRDTLVASDDDDDDVVKHVDNKSTVKPITQLTANGQKNDYVTNLKTVKLAETVKFDNKRDTITSAVCSDDSRRNTLIASDEDEEDSDDADSDKSDDTVNERLMNLNELLSFSRFPNSNETSRANNTKAMSPQSTKEMKTTVPVKQNISGGNKSAKPVITGPLSERISPEINSNTNFKPQPAPRKSSNVRQPAGIPTRELNNVSTNDDTANPMRRLRQPPPPIPTAKPTNVSQLNANASFFAKLREQEGFTENVNGSSRNTIKQK